MKKRFERAVFGVVGAAMLTVCAVGCSALSENEKTEEVVTNRFTVLSEEHHNTDTFRVILDNETGYQYLFVEDDDGSGLVRLDPVEVPESLTEEIEEVKPEVPEAKPQEAPEPKEEQPAVVSMGKFKITAYCSCKTCCDKWAVDRPVDENGNEIVYTASGTVAKQGRTIAVDPSVIPYGTTVFFAGQAYTAEDTGGSIDGNRIDVYFSSHEAAKEWGVQYHDVSIQI